MSNNITNIETLLLTGKRVFTIEDLAVIWRVSDRRKLIELIKYYVRQNRLTRLHKGVYAYGTDYTDFDIAQKLVPLSYVSLYSASLTYGLTFQHYESVFCVSLSSKKYFLNGQTYVYHRVKEPIFYNQIGLINNGRYIIADKERTICDCLYVFPGLAFDNLRDIDREKLIKLSKIYDNSRLEKDIKKLLSMIE